MPLESARTDSTVALDSRGCYHHCDRVAPHLAAPSAFELTGGVTDELTGGAPDDRGSIAAWLLALRSGLVQSWRSAALLALMFGAVGGIAVAALSTADRVQSSYDELLTEIDAPDLVVFCEGCASPEGGVFTEGPLADPAIAYVAVLQEVYPLVYTADGVLLGPFERECETGAGELSALQPPGRDLRRRPFESAMAVFLHQTRQTRSRCRRSQPSGLASRSATNCL